MTAQVHVVRHNIRVTRQQRIQRGRIQQNKYRCKRSARNRCSNHYCGLQFINSVEMQRSSSASLKKSFIECSAGMLMCSHHGLPILAVTRPSCAFSRKLKYDSTLLSAFSLCSSNSNSKLLKVHQSHLHFFLPNYPIQPILYIYCASDEVINCTFTEFFVFHIWIQVQMRTITKSLILLCPGCSEYSICGDDDWVCLQALSQQHISEVCHVSHLHCI